MCLVVFFLINYYWSIVALQCCFCFFCRAKGISFMFTFIPSFGFPSHSGHHGALSRVPCVIQQGLISYQFYGGCSAARLCSALWDPMDCSPSGFPVLHHLPEFAQNSCPLSQWCHPIISSSVGPFLLLPAVFPNIRVFSNESALGIRWPKYWSFCFNICIRNSGFFTTEPPGMPHVVFVRTLLL